MNKKTKVSVLMSAYNAEKYIAEAIESILAQTFADFEFLIINDGSTDKTADIIRAFDDARIQFIDNPKNQGLVPVLNQGIDLARGEYIARMDADDISLPARLEKQVAYMDANPDVGVLGTAIEYFPDTNVQKLPENDFDIKSMMMRLHAVVHPTIMIRKSVLIDNGIKYKPGAAEDYELYCDLIAYTKFANLPDVLFKYRWHGDNISTRNRKAISQHFKEVQARNRIRYSREKFYTYTKKKHRLFGVIPFLKVITECDTTKFYLFEKILIYTTKKYDYV